MKRTYGKKFNKIKEDFASDIKSLQDNASSENFINRSNAIKRKYFSAVELLRMDLEEEPDGTKTDLWQEMRDWAVSETLYLTYIDRHHWYDKLDELSRAAVVWSCLIAFAMIVALPIILIRPFEDVLIALGWIEARWSLSNIIKYLVSQWLLLMSGIRLKVTGVTEETFTLERPILVPFTHSSTMDAFIIAAAIPPRFFAMAKLELFLIPFFSWLLIAFGGMPVNRNDRKQAVRSLGIAAKSVIPGDAIAMSPEGTRTLTGQLAPAFKKGMGHIWEQTNARIVPVVIIGAYELFPQNRQMTLTGHAHMHYLPSFDPDDVLTDEERRNTVPRPANDELRDRVNARVRRGMLGALAEQSDEVGRELSYTERAASIIATLIFIGTLTVTLRYANHVFHQLGYESAYVAAAHVFGVSFAITAVLFVLSLYGPKLGVIISALRRSKSEQDLKRD